MFAASLSGSLEETLKALLSLESKNQIALDALVKQAANIQQAILSLEGQRNDLLSKIATPSTELPCFN